MGVKGGGVVSGSRSSSSSKTMRRAHQQCRNHPRTLQAKHRPAKTPSLTHNPRQRPASPRITKRSRRPPKAPPSNRQPQARPPPTSLSRARQPRRSKRRSLGPAASKATPIRTNANPPAPATRHRARPRTSSAPNNVKPWNNGCGRSPMNRANCCGANSGTNSNNVRNKTDDPLATPVSPGPALRPAQR